MNSLAKSFELSSCAAALRRAEDAQARGAERVDDAGGQRRLGADDGELRRCSRCANATSSGIAGRRATLVSPGSRAVPALPGATNTVRDARRLRELPRQRVLAAAAADDEDVHGCRTPVSAGSGACR